MGVGNAGRPAAPPAILSPDQSFTKNRREWQEHRTEAPFPGGESYQQVVERTRDFLNDLFPELDGARVLLIAHSANRWALQHLLLGAPLEEVVEAPFDWQEGWEYALPGQLTVQG